MDEAIHEEKRHGLTIKIFRDECEDSPEEFGDEALFLTGYHRDFSVEGPCALIPEHLREVTHKSYCTECYQRNYTTVEETGKKCGKCGKAARVNKNYYKTAKGAPLVSKADCQALARGKKEDPENYPDAVAEKYFFFGLEAYIHSGVRLALSREGNFPDRQWDVSQLGLVFVSKKEWKTREKARKAALGLIETWNDYLSGNVYGYQIIDAAGEDVDSCWGFYGDYKKGALKEARAMVDSLTSDGTTDEKGQLLISSVLAES